MEHEDPVRMKKLSVIMSFLVALLIVWTSSVLHAKAPDAGLSQKNGVVKVYVIDRSGKYIASANGFIIDKNGIIVTDCQVVGKWFKKSDSILRVEMEGGRQFPLEDVISRRCENNLVLIKIDTTDLPAFRLHRNYKPQKGEKITILQGPTESMKNVAGGTIKGILKPGQLIQTSIPVKPGNTGSPVLNMDGDVIGATVISSKKGKNMHQAALLDTLLKQLELYKKSAELKKNIRMPYQPKKEAKPTVTADEYFLLGCNYTTSRSYREAIEAYKESLRKNPNFTDAYLNLGVVYYKIGKYPEAIDAFKKATLSSPESLSAYHKLGTTYIIRGAYSDAIEVFQKAITIDPDNSEAHFNLGIAYFLSGDRTAAFGEYVTLKNIDKERADLLREILVN